MSLKSKQIFKFSGVPRCTTVEQYKEWSEMARKIIPPHGFCTDCTPEYQAKMIEQKRCEFVGIKFRTVYDEEDKNKKTHKIERKGGIEGYFPKQEFSEGF